MYSFKDLRKANKLSVNADKLKLVILGNCATQFLSTAIKGYAGLTGINLDIYDADYNQFEAQLLDENSDTYMYYPDFILLWVSTDKIYEEFLDLALNERNNFAEIYLKKLEQYWNWIGEKSNAKILQMNFTEIDDKVLGNYSCKIESCFTYQIRKLNYLLQDAMHQNSNVYPVDLLGIQIDLGRNMFYDAKFYYSAKMCVSTNALPYIAKAVVDIILAMSGRIKKCMVLDLDNTLWGGIIGDDGINNIEIGELGKGHAFSNLQRWIKQLKEYGIILAVCSKNDDSIAKEPFQKLDDMILRLDDISLFVANWNDKASNMKYIQESLNIGMDSIVFLDDNPFERDSVRNLVPEVEVPELPEDPAHYLEFLQKCNLFEVVSFNGENVDRTKSYQAEFARRESMASFTSMDDYLRSLEMYGTAEFFNPSKYSRIAQLTQRSNQFNLRTVRYTEDDIRRIAESDEYVAVYYTLKDKFGDHGLVGVVIMKKQDEDAIFIDTWLMSCRVLKRGMEEFIANKFVECAKKHGYQRILAEYIPTEKNRMVYDLYSRMGFASIGENQFLLDIDLYKEKNTFIKEKNSE